MNEDKEQVDAREPARRGPEPTLEEMQAAGMFFPSEWAVPVLRLSSNDPPTISDFCGTATLIGADWFLTACHVIERAFAVEAERPYLLLLEATDSPRLTFARIAAFERHSRPAVDLALGRLAQWNATPPFSGWGFPAALSDVICIGHAPDVTTGRVLTEEGFGSPRFFKGYVMRQLEAGEEPLITAPSFELSFPIPAGMSGAPVFQSPPGGRLLCGIATHSVATRLESWEEVTQASQEKPLVREITARVIHVGVGIRLSALLDWKISLNGGSELRTLIGPQASGP